MGKHWRIMTFDIEPWRPRCRSRERKGSSESPLQRVRVANRAGQGLKAVVTDGPQAWTRQRMMTDDSPAALPRAGYGASVARSATMLTRTELTQPDHGGTIADDAEEESMRERQEKWPGSCRDLTPSTPAAQERPAFANTSWMPKNILKSIGRRRSSSNALDLPPPTASTGESSFRVIERPQKPVQHTFNSSDDRPQTGRGTQRAFNSHLAALRGKSTDDLGLGANRWVKRGNAPGTNPTLNIDRGSAGTTNSGSSGFYESSSASARYSSTSTLPSSLDAEREPDDGDLFARKATPTHMHKSLPTTLDDPLPPPPSFSTRAARAFSFGNKHSKAESTTKNLPPLPPNYHAPTRSPNKEQSPVRERALTTSSYASTAIPTQVESNLSLGLEESSFGDDFGNMFSNLGNAKAPSPKRETFPTAPVGFHRTVGIQNCSLKKLADEEQESEPQFPPRTLSRDAFRSTPSPSLHVMRNQSESPYSLDSHDSNEGLVSSTLSSPELEEDRPSVPVHNRGVTPTFLTGSKGAYSRVPERVDSPSLESSLWSNELEKQERQMSPEQSLPTRQAQSNDSNRWTKPIADRPPIPGPSPESALRPVNTQDRNGAGVARSPIVEGEAQGWHDESINTTPRAAKSATTTFDHTESLFDSSPLGPPSRAVRPDTSRTESAALKKMTKAQFEYLQRRGDSRQDEGEDEAHQDDDYDDEDDSERAKQLSQQRRRQEATMAVYRQQMKKVTGGGPTDLPGSTMRPSLDRSSQSAPAGSMLHFGGIGGVPPSDSQRGKQDMDEDDDEVPLGILQAHGFPSASRPPTIGEHNRTPSIAGGSVVNGGAGQGSLPPFARRLPMDPYFGAGIANQANRESLAFGGAGSVYGGSSAGGPQQGNHPGGLVGVIASEERAKAARRGSPNPVTGTYNAAPQQTMPQMPRTMSMANITSPQSYVPSGFGGPMMPGMHMPQMPMMGQDPASQQMQQFMAMQMQMMQNMMAMQQQMGQSPQPMLQPTSDYLGVPMAGQRPTSVASNGTSFGMGSNQGRTMSMMHQPAGWTVPPGVQRPASQMNLSHNYAPSVQGMSLAGGGPGAGYTPSIAPSERSNVGMPSRYRPVTQGGDGRTNSMTSSMTLQAFTSQAPNESVPETQQQPTVRAIDKPKGAPKAMHKPAADDDDEEGWAEMAKKRSEKKFSWRRKDKENKEPALSELYNTFD
nr:hypothetical protein CFP56_75493 [Quercus suber]